MIIVFRIAVPVESRRSCVQEMVDAFRFYIKYLELVNFVGENPTFDKFMREVHRQLVAGDMSEVNPDFGQAMKDLERHAYIPENFNEEQNDFARN